MKTPRAAAARVVTITPIPDSEYVSVTCSWENEPRKSPIAASAAPKFAEGWKAELVTKGDW